MSAGDAVWERAVEALATAGSVALACHVDPDGDGIGSMLALRRAVAAGRDVHVDAGWAGDVEGGGLVVPTPYAFLPDLEHLSGPDGFKPAPDVFVALDCATPERLGCLQALAAQAAQVLVIDHHAAGAEFGDVRLVVPDAAATAEIVTDLIDRLGVTLDRDIATCLYVGLVTDTGRFTYSSVTPASMQLGARLLATGIDQAWINRQLWETHSFGYLKVLASALQRAAFEPGVGLVWTAVTQAELTGAGVSLAETEGLIDVLRTIAAAECALVCKEQADGSWQASLRSKRTVDVGAVAQQLGGGGHVYAAGFEASGSLEDVVAAVRDAIAAEGRGEA